MAPKTAVFMPKTGIFGKIFGKYTIFGKIFGGISNFWQNFWRLNPNIKYILEVPMRKKNFKGGRVLKAKSCKCVEMLKLYDKLQVEYVKLLEADENVEEFYCNVSIGPEYNTDFIGVYKNGDKFVRECVFRNQISLPRMCKLLDESRNYWLKQGIIDWGIVTDKEEENEDN